MTLDELIIHNQGIARNSFVFHQLGNNDAFLAVVGFQTNNPSLVVRTRLGFLCNHEDWIKRATELGFPQNSGDTKD